MFDKSKQNDDIPNSKVKFKQKINKKKQKEVALSKPPLKTPQISGNGLKKRRRYKNHATKRKTQTAEKNSNVRNVNSHLSNPEPQHVPHNGPPEAENNNSKKKKKNKNKTAETADVTNSFSTEISVKSRRKSDCHEAKEETGSLSLEHETEISGHSISKKRKHDDTKIKNKSKRKKRNSNGNEKENQNYDIDKLGEVILDVKKNKYDKKIKNDDEEDILLCENIGDSKKSKKNKKSNEVVTVKTENGHEKDVSKTKKKKKCEIKSNDSDINGTADKNVDKESALNIEGTKLKPKVRDNQKKKDKIKKILELGNRNNIKASGNSLRDRMLERLKAAKFRYLNEKLYTSSGSEAQELFQSDPEAFQTYHEGYQQQLKKWPVNPLDLIIKKIEKMPASHVIADMGCGTAALAARVPHAVHSFDLVAGAAGVRACDMAHTPLPPASVDVAVYCLALMGTQLAQYLLEANRILKLGGTLLIAEVESRFSDAEAFARALAPLGFRLRRLERRRVFLLLELGKAGAPRRGRLPDLSLKPCLYKKR